MFNSTIVAISSPFGESGIGIIRISGKDSFKIADKIFRRKDKKKICDLLDHSINYGWIIDPESNEVVDEILLTIMKEPRTYTKENMVEINCHGGWIALNRTMDLIINLGARIALPGEFTKRAFINGRIDLTQAEAVLDIIRAKTENGLYSALGNLRGSIKNRIEEIRKRILTLVLFNNAKIDFGEQVSIKMNKEIEIIDRLIDDFENLLEQYNKKKGIAEGIKIVFCGRTNVGKSSLINAIYGENRIITSKIPGTTRDCIQIDIYLDGAIYHIIDTAGLRNARTEIERISIKNSENEIKKSDCLIIVFDNSRKLSPDDKGIIEWINRLNKDKIWVINKTDLITRIKIKELEEIIKTKEIIKVSAKSGSGIDKLLLELKRRKESFSGKIYNGFFINKRQKAHLINVRNGLNKIRDLYIKGMGEEIISEELKYSIKELDEITGNGIDNNKIDEIFNQFCIGK